MHGAGGRRRWWWAATGVVALAAVTVGARHVWVQEVASGGYLGVETCKLCHEAEYNSWVATRHAHSFAALAKRDEGNAKACVPCHTTGNGQPGGYVDQSSTPGLLNVQCESCHGPGQEHVDGAGDKDKIIRVPRASVCAACHLDRHIH